MGGDTSPPQPERSPYWALDSKGRIRQKIAKTHLLSNFDDSEDFEELISIYDEWRKEIDYIVLTEKMKACLEDKFFLKKRIFAVKCAKRGNDVYINFRIKKRLKQLFKISKIIKEGKVKALFLTLTCDTSRYKGRTEAWNDISSRWNRFVSWLRRERKIQSPDLSKKYIGFFRIYESTRKGFPHIHAILFFRSRVWIPKKRLDEIWGAHTWIEECRRVKGSIGYLLKYLEKGFKEESYMLAPSILWMFGLRSFGVSKNIFQFIQDYLHNSNTIQINLLNEKVSDSYFLFNGIYSIDELMEEAIKRKSISRFRLGNWLVSLDFLPTEREEFESEKM